MRILYGGIFGGRVIYNFLANSNQPTERSLEQVSCFWRILRIFGVAVQVLVRRHLGLCICGFRFMKMIFRFQELGDLGVGMDLGFGLGDLGLLEVREVFSVNGWNTFQVSVYKPRLSILKWVAFDNTSNCQMNMFKQ